MNKIGAVGYSLPGDAIAKEYKQVRPYQWEQVFYSKSKQFEGTEKDFVQAGYGYKYIQVAEFKRMPIQDN